MRRQFFHVEHLQSMRFQDAHRSQHGEIGEVLVIDRVELIALDQPQQVGKL